jgi:hypothetical protein
MPVCQRVVRTNQIHPCGEMYIEFMSFDERIRDRLAALLLAHVEQQLSETKPLEADG